MCLTLKQTQNTGCWWCNVADIVHIELAEPDFLIKINLPFFNVLVNLVNMRMPYNTKLQHAIGGVLNYKLDMKHLNFRASNKDIFLCQIKSVMLYNFVVVFPVSCTVFKIRTLFT